MVSFHASPNCNSLYVRSNAYEISAGKFFGVSVFLVKVCFTCRNCGGGDRGRVAIYRPFGEVSLSLNRTVTCMVLKANDRRTSCPCHDEFRGPRSDYVRQNFIFLPVDPSDELRNLSLL
ncbi:uncharacterized protein TNCV_4066741 [Trichonephila clavipes]|uniref:Uncharacterized protein n=1 Tax=Trichonephila clavipes TaxID=2585209 RepID=A0A8X7BH88_TRICX|nr:uncharacterized protein TNCV_4066741 [Trichonephila clavipes]